MNSRNNLSLEITVDAGGINVESMKKADISPILNRENSITDFGLFLCMKIAFSVDFIILFRINKFLRMA